MARYYAAVLAPGGSVYLHPTADKAPEWVTDIVKAERFLADDGWAVAWPDQPGAATLERVDLYRRLAADMHLYANEIGNLYANEIANSLVQRAINEYADRLTELRDGEH
jgi:hypothetical protein